MCETSSNCRKVLGDHQMIVVEMLFKAQEFVVSNMLKSRYDLLAMVEFMMRVEVLRFIA